MPKESVNVLIVDDELPICDLLEEVLSINGYRVVVATSGKEAIRKFQEVMPDLVLLDIRMPDMSGLEVLGRIRELDRNAGVIMLSAFGDFNTIQEALNRGASYYMEKPIELDRLMELIAVWRNGPAAGDENDIP